jgi:arylsulfatase A-like enzyme
VLTAEKPLHLEEHLDVARIEGSEPPVAGPETIVWRFDEPQPDWKAFSLIAPPNLREATRADDALRIRVTEVGVPTIENESLFGAGIYIDAPSLLRLRPAHLMVRARTESAGVVSVSSASLDDSQSRHGVTGLFQEISEPTPIIADGSVQGYLLPFPLEQLWARSGSTRMASDVCCRVGVMFQTYEPGNVDILSVTAVSTSAAFVSDPLGVMTVADGSNESRRTMFTHAPGRVAYTVHVPPGGRLDVGLAVVRNDAPVDFKVTVAAARGEEHGLLEETVADRAAWIQRSVDLATYAGQEVTLALQADAETPGTVVLWGAPVVSGSSRADRPNVVFYVIDGAAAQFMSVYGYNRHTTPNLVRLASEGAVFEQAYSNSTWTRTSTPSFMTSLHHSVLGGYLTGTDPLPEQAVTMAEHMHRGGYQTAVFTANPYAGTMSTLDRGVDVLRDTWDGFTCWPRSSHSASSVWLHEAFWQWREAYPAQPYWAHFQSVDVHQPWHPAAPFAGLFGNVDAPQRLSAWQARMEEVGSWDEPWLAALAGADIDALEYISVAQGLYDEGMAHNDYQIGRLVDRIKAAGEWENTIFIVAADHSHDNAGLPSLASMSAPFWEDQAIFSPWESRIPLIVVWPARIAAGQRFSQPVSMIDVVPTIVDLAGLPIPEITQGQSLAPLLLGQGGWEPRPVIFDEFYASFKSDTLFGRIGVVDGRWGASLLVNRDPFPQEEGGRAARLLLFDLWTDPNLSHSLHEERPDLMEQYTAFLEAQWEAHQALAQRFTRSGEGLPLTPEQLQTLRSLGYIH